MAIDLLATCRFMPTSFLVGERSDRDESSAAAIWSLADIAYIAI